MFAANSDDVLANDNEVFAEHGTVFGVIGKTNSFLRLIMELIRRFLQAPLTTMARAQLNIHNTINKSRNEMVNTLMDVDSPVPEEIIGQIAGISGVLSVRYLPLRQP